VRLWTMAWGGLLNVPILMGHKPSPRPYFFRLIMNGEASAGRAEFAGALQPVLVAVGTASFGVPPTLGAPPNVRGPAPGFLLSRIFRVPSSRKKESGPRTASFLIQLPLSLFSHLDFAAKLRPPGACPRVAFTKRPALFSGAGHMANA